MYIFKCKLLLQAHLNHLCTPMAHLGSWPPPPINSILVPPNFPLTELPNLLLAHQKPPMFMMGQQAPMYTGQPMMGEMGGPIVFNRPPPRSPPRGNQPSWMNRPLQPSQQTNFQGNKRQPFQPNKRSNFENNNNQGMRPKFFPSRKNPGKPRPLRTNLNQEQMNENSQNVPPVQDGMGAFKTTDMLQSSRVLI